jgi:hypothetical protein
VLGFDDVDAAGDATTLPIKQGGLVAQQADAVAEAIAASFGQGIDPQPVRPILRGVLLTGGAARYSGAISTVRATSRACRRWRCGDLRTGSAVGISLRI